MNSRWIECALVDFPDNEARIPWAIHAERRPHGTVVVVEINVRTGATDECIIVEERHADTAIGKALNQLRAVTR